MHRFFYNPLAALAPIDLCINCAYPFAVFNLCGGCPTSICARHPLSFLSPRLVVQLEFSQALDVNYAGNIGYLRRASTSPTTDADLTLPSPGTSGSLSDSVAIAIDTTVSQIAYVNTTVANGSYGVGQEVPVLLTFTVPVEFNT